MKDFPNRPNFFIVGAPNTGTTSLWHLLRQHPEIYLSQKKEPRFFSDPNYLQHWDDYRRMFEKAAGYKAIGEASVNYCEDHLFPGTAHRLFEFNSNARILYMVRDPIKRVESTWTQALSTGHWYRKYYSHQLMPLDFSQALFTYPHLTESTRYWERLQPFLEKFPAEQIIILFLEDLSRNPKAFLSRLFRFLGVTDNFIPKHFSARNRAVNKRMLRPIFLHLAFPGFPTFWERIYRNTRSLCWPIRPLVGRKPIPPVWDQKTKALFIQEIRLDALQILHYARKPADFWASLNDPIQGK